MTNRDDAELGRSLHDALDPSLPDSRARQRVLVRLRGAMAGTGSRPRWRRHPLPARVSGMAMALSAVVIIVGAFGLGLSLRSRPHPAPIPAQSVPPATVPPYPSKLPISAVPSPTPLATPAAIAYVSPNSVSFVSATVGWALGSGCDSQNRCELSIARTTNGGSAWSLVSIPPDADPTNASLQISASSASDAWIWGASSTNQPVFSATHDGGRSWHGINLGSAPVIAVAIANGTVWAKTDCGSQSAPCGARLLSSPVHSDVWTPLGPLPAAVQGPPVRSGTWFGGLIRFGGRAWIVGSNQLPNAIARTDDNGHSWVSLSVPCDYGGELYLGASSMTHVMLACTTGGAIPAPQEVFSSDDGGSHWTLRSREGFSFQVTPTRPDVGHIGSGGFPIGLVVVDENTAWMTQDREDDLVTRDGGRTWAGAALPQTVFGGGGGGEGLTFSDPLHGWIFASAGVWHTTDGGLHWQYQPVIGRVGGYQ